MIKWPNKSTEHDAGHKTKIATIPIYCDKNTKSSFLIDAFLTATCTHAQSKENNAYGLPQSKHKIHKRIYPFSSFYRTASLRWLYHVLTIYVLSKKKKILHTPEQK